MPGGHRRAALCGRTPRSPLPSQRCCAYVEAGSRASQSARKFSGSARSLCPALPITTAVPWDPVLVGQAHLRLGTVAPHLEDSPSLEHSLCLRTVDRAADASRFDPRTAVAHDGTNGAIEGESEREIHVSQPLARLDGAEAGIVKSSSASTAGGTAAAGTPDTTVLATSANLQARRQDGIPSSVVEVVQVQGGGQASVLDALHRPRRAGSLKGPHRRSYGPHGSHSSGHQSVAMPSDEGPQARTEHRRAGPVVLRQPRRSRVPGRHVERRCSVAVPLLLVNRSK